jgi:hypothetical protein
MISRSIYNLKIDTICMCYIPFNRSLLQLSNGIRHVMPSTEIKLELTAKASMAQPVLQPAVCTNGLNRVILFLCTYRAFLSFIIYNLYQQIHFGTRHKTVNYRNTMHTARFGSLLTSTLDAPKYGISPSNQYHLIYYISK